MKNTMSNEQVCRTCLTTRPRSWCKLVPQHYTFCTSISIPDDDLLPKILCLKCFNTIGRFYSFKKQCIQSAQTLQYSIGENNTEYKSDVHIKTEIPSPIDDDLISNSENDHFYEDIGREMHLDDFMDQENSDNNDNKDAIFDNSMKLSHDVENKYKLVTRKKKIMKNKKYAQEIPKKKYINTHSKKLSRNFPCSECDRRFITQERLDVHFSKIHSKKKNYICDVCGGSYHKNYLLKVHMETHEIRERTHECTICGGKYLSERNLKGHMSSQHKTKILKCVTCDRLFKSKSKLSQHMLIHEGIKPYTCDICKKSYSTCTFLKIHRRTHTGERPFDCDWCSMNFLSKVRLKEHIRKHTGEKPYKCAVCNQAFSQSGTMKRHMKTHDKLNYKIPSE